ncbi:MAG TPA: hypothetical protein VF648_16725 [Pyrinomonadaceae bacterium]
MQIFNYANLSTEQISELKRELAGRENLLQVVAWNNQVVDSIAQDEFTHDLVIRWRDFYLVFDAT